MKSAALYVHIPFCLKKCSYCDFFSVENSGRIDDLYLECLKNEAAFYAEKYKIDFWSTIYIGGGTPSLLSAIVVVSVADYGAFEHIFQMFLQVTWIFMWVCW